MEKKADVSIYERLLAAQAEFPVISKNTANPFFKSTYADLPTILAAVLPVLNRNGLGLIQHPQSGPGLTGVETVIYTADGQTLVSQMSSPLPEGCTGQQLGSLQTYLRRYSISGILSLQIADSDDDGNAASATTVGSGAQPVRTLPARELMPPSGSARLLETVLEKSGVGKESGKPWRLHILRFSGGAEAKTFDNDVAAAARGLIGRWVEVGLTDTPRGSMVDAIQEAAFPEEVEDSDDIPF